MYLRTSAIHILFAGIDDAVKIFFFDSIWVHKNEAAHSQARELFCHDASGPRAPNNGNRQSSE